MKSKQADTILVADDSPVFRKAVAEALRLSGRRVLLAEDGITALRLLEEEHVDLALLDICMPGLDGGELLEKMRLGEALRDVPVIFVSALNQSEVPSLIDFPRAQYFDKTTLSFKQLRARIDLTLDSLHKRPTSFANARCAVTATRCPPR
jgi:adenylate cyclase